MWKLCESCCRGAEGDENEMREMIPMGQGGPSSRPTRTPWEPQPADIFNLARPLAPSDSVIVKGKISSNAKEYTINLLSDQSGHVSVALQFKVSFESKLVELSHEEGGGLSSPELLRDSFENATTDQTNENTFSIKFRVAPDPPPTLVVEADHSYVSEVQTKLLPSIRYLQVLGDVDKVLSLTFEFGS